MKPDTTAQRVKITFVSPDGKRYTPDEFFEMLKAEKDERDASNPK